MASAQQTASVAPSMADLKHGEDIMAMRLDQLAERVTQLTRVLTVMGGLGFAGFAWAGNNLYQLNREVGVLTTQQATIQQDLNKTVDQLTSLNATLGKVVERMPALQGPQARP